MRDNRNSVHTVAVKKKVVVIFLLSILGLGFVKSILAQTSSQSHPLSEITPIDVNLNMYGYNITNVSYVGIGLITPLYPLDIAGDVRWSGTLVGGSVPWQRLTNFPTGCPPGYAVQAIGSDLTCIQINATQGVVNGSGTPNFIPIWVDTNTLGNSSIYQSGGLIYTTSGVVLGGNLNLNNNQLLNAILGSNLNANNYNLTNVDWIFANNVQANTFYGNLQGTASDLECTDCVTLGKETVGDYVANITAGDGITVSGSRGEGSTPTISHADTSNQTTVANTGLTFIQNVTLDTFGHVTELASATINAGSGLTASGTTLNVGAGNCISVDANTVGVGSNCIDDAEIADTYKTVSIQDSTGTEQFAVTDGNKALQIAAGSGISLAFDATNHRVTITDANAGSEITGSGTANYVAKFTGSNTIGNSSIYESGGNVGIGTTAPTTKLDVNGGALFSSTAGGTTGHVKILSSPSVAGQGGLLLTQVAGYTAGSTAFKLYTTGTGGTSSKLHIAGVDQGTPDTVTNLVTIQYNGNVGIGTTSPSAKLDVVGGDIEINDGAAFGNYRIKGHRQLYVGDETEVSTTSTTYVLKKKFTAVFDGTYGINPRYVNVIARLKNTGGYTTSLNVTIVGCNSTILTTTSTSYTLVKGSIDTSTCGDGAYPVEISLKTSNSAGTAYNDIIEFYYVE